MDLFECQGPSEVCAVRPRVPERLVDLPFISMLGSGNYLSFLGDAILEWAEEHSQPAEHEDVVRSFFKHYVSSEATFLVCMP